MSYLDIFMQEQKSKLTEINFSVRTLYEEAKKNFHDLQPNENFAETELKIADKIFIDNCDFTGNFECHLNFDNCFFQNISIFYDASFKKVNFKNCFFAQELIISETADFKGEFNLITLNVRRQVLINGGTYKTCHWSMVNNGALIVNQGKFEELNIGYWGGALFKEVNLNLGKVSGNIKVTGLHTKIEWLRIFQSSVDVSIAIEDIALNCISIYRFRNEKSFRLFNIKVFKSKHPTEFFIGESYLGKAEFYSIDMTSFDNLFFKDVHLVDCSFVNIKWKYEIDSFVGRGIGKSKDEEKLPSKIAKLKNELKEEYFEIENLKNDPSVLNFFSKNRETYRQLKYALGKQGDIINEQKFHSKEMVAYNRTLDFKKEPWTKLIIKMSDFFSDFGQSFTRPLIALFIGHWVLLVILILSGYFSELSINLSTPNWAGFKEALEQYFTLINPFRRAEFAFKGYYIVIDLVMRVWSSYMIYNVIRATRRFIK
jgi:hypothetical protein